MAKLSIIQREKKRATLVLKYAAKRDAIKEQLKSPDLEMEELLLLRKKLQKLPINSAATRQRNRCSLTGRPRGVYRKFGISRIKIRELSMSGDLPGVVKSSW